MSIDDFPMISLPPAMTDDDVAFHSDITYMRALLGDISDLVYDMRVAPPFPIELSDALADASDKLKAVKW